MADSAITFIGAGNMASSIVSGLIANGYPSNKIAASDPSTENLNRLESEFKVVTSNSNAEVTSGRDVIVLAVKPQVMEAVCREMSDYIDSHMLIISIAAGVPCTKISQWLGAELATVRCMPNTPALLQEGASGLYANAHVTEQQRALAESILSAVGTVNWIAEESLIDTVTAVSGSGPAYFFLFIEAMIDAGVAMGLDKPTAETLAKQTAYGASKLARESDVDIQELRRRVTSPNGTTERAIASFEANNLRKIVAEAMEDCRKRAHELGQ